MSNDSPDTPDPLDTGQPRRLTYTERRQARFQMRVEKWEERRAGPPPPRTLHRTIIMIVMMLAMLVLLWLLVSSGQSA